MKETEPWRAILCWGCTIAFLGVPPAIFIAHAFGVGENLLGKAGYMREWYYSVSAMLFSLAGFKTWERVKENGNGTNQPTHKV